MAPSVLAMEAAVAIHEVALCVEKQLARRLRSQQEAYAAGHQSRDEDSVWSEVYGRYEVLSQPVR
jgi:hypothetical protein